MPWLFNAYSLVLNVFTHLGLIMTKSDNTPINRTQRDYSTCVKSSDK